MGSRLDQPAPPNPKIINPLSGAEMLGVWDPTSGAIAGMNVSALGFIMVQYLDAGQRTR